MTTQTSARPTQRRELTLLAGLYVSQFLGVGFFYTGVVGILRSQGASLDQLGLIQLLGLLWGVKFLWAPLVDWYGSARRGHFRSWLLVLQPLIAVCLLVMAAIDPVNQFSVLMVVAALVVLLSATQDVAADALAARMVEHGTRGVANGIQVAGGYLGNILGGGAVLVVYDVLGWAPALVTLAAMTVLPVWMIARHREPPRGVSPESRPSLRDFARVFRAPGVARWTFLVLPLLLIGVSSAQALVTPMLVDAGWSLATIGTFSTMVAGAVAIAAALATGLLVRRFGRLRILVLAGAIQAVAILALLVLAGREADAAVIAVIVCLVNGAYGAVATVVYTVHMDLSRSATAGSDYTLLASFAFMAGLIGGAVGLGVAASVGYGWVIVAAAVLVAAGVALAPVALAPIVRAAAPVSADEGEPVVDPAVDPVVALGRPGLVETGDPSWP
ncbi:Predicted arabinose efflux permease, MFS family [Quadrisphaera granulorum]|uniref:Putative MFS family arabinose efflux permease n=1 Tax=Quadrisphaera granulorum TaxID=317664 RepID=A0A316A9B5_9ACTN|nr:MFS transporter [Quadrisphaera granulorum]PWJ54345.1 putative MFS family arabinose efflux permease [Quadrisphaera granulorum]SZE96117.1 Predicted arabinose efflux permease, MFS family [Quadrisphaera granulorum]